MSGAPLTLIQKTISARKMPARAEGVTKRRRLDETAVLAFALAEALPEELHVSPEIAYRLLRDAPAADGGVPDELVIGRMVRIDASAALAATRHRLALYEPHGN
jgi:hypothetical protein